MKNLLACLALCASLSASAQGDNCTVLGIQDLTQMVFELQAQLNAQDATMDSLQNASMTRDSVRAIARGEAAFWGSVGHADLEGVNLENNSNDGLIFLAYLVGANFAGANLSEADFAGANLSGADFSDADLSYADLRFAGLPGADLSGADLYFADLYFANLSGADLTGASLSGADLSGANLSGATMTCLQSCSSALPSGYICENESDCSEPYRYRIVPQ